MLRQFKRYLSSSSSSNRIVQSTAPSGIPLHKIFNTAFPLSLRDSIQQWTKRSQLQEAESNLLDCVGLNPQNTLAPYSARSFDVPVEIAPNSVLTNWGLRGKSPLGNPTMNELEIKNTAHNSESEKHIVLVHGYGASKGYFYQNFKPLASKHTVHALDWLGYGLSSRITPRITKFPNLADGVKYGENWFLTPFESWRKRRGLSKFTIVAHSLGAYLACAYASMYPERVEKLVLVSPASVNRTSASIPANQLYPGACEEELAATMSPIIGKAPNVPSWFTNMWERHWSPFVLVRHTGWMGPKFTSGWTSRRFARLPSREQLALQDYSYRMFNAKGSGEYLLNYFLASGGTGRWPLAERLSQIQCPSLWLYGDRDWMDVNGGIEAAKRLTANNRQAAVQVISNSGHHLYLDNQQSFNNAVLNFLQ